MDKRSKVVYVSGPHTGSDYTEIDKNIMTARWWSIKVWEAGYTVICPHTNTIHLEVDCKCEYNDYILGDLELLRRSDVILLIPGWEDSSGANHEKQSAQDNNIPIVYASMDDINMKEIDKVFDE